MKKKIVILLVLAGVAVGFAGGVFSSDAYRDYQVKQQMKSFFRD